MKCVKRLTADQQRLVEENLTIVERVLRFDINANPCVAGLGYEDLYQEGCVWLCNAALTFDPARGSFASYARRVVQNGLSFCSYSIFYFRHKLYIVLKNTPCELLEFTVHTAYYFISAFRGSLLPTCRMPAASLAQPQPRPS